MDCLSRSHCLPLLLLLVSAAMFHVVTATCTNSDPCVTDCAGCDEFAKVADPTDCRGYYLCDASGNPYPAPFVCPDGEVFDAASHDCVAGDTCDLCPPVCNYECSSFSTSAAYALACGYYYECSGGAITGIVPCSGEGLYFDGLSCQSDVSRCCHCRPYCTAADVGKLIEDPQDCRKYYACTAVGPTDIVGECPDGQNFDVTAPGCSATASCDIADACRNVVDEDGCIEPFTCLTTGKFAKCPSQCTPDYYQCSAANNQFVEATSCTDDKVFNPDSKTCVSSSQCPY